MQICMIDSLEDYIEYYKLNKKLPYPQVSYSAKELNERQLATKYKDYCKKIKNVKEKQENNEESEYLKNLKKAKEEARKLDPEGKTFYNSLTEEQKDFLKRNSFGKFNNLDPAHIFSTGEYPFLADEIENIVMIPRYVHSYIDQMLNPFSDKHEKLTKEQHSELWIQFVGEERYKSLLVSILAYRYESKKL